MSSDHKPYVSPETPTFLDSLIQSIKKERTEGKDDLVILRQLCDKICNEEHDRMLPDQKDLYNAHAPKGPNIILCLPVPGRNDKEYGYLALEREFYLERPTKTDKDKDEFLVVYWIYKKYAMNEPPRKIKAIKIPDINPLKVISFYAKTISYFRGE
jgi:hypothetical protein